MSKIQSVFKQAFLNLLPLLLISAVATATFAAGEVDPAFKPAVQHTFGGIIRKLVVQPDGKLLVAGNYAAAGNSSRTGIARLNADGTLDETFSPPEIYQVINNTSYDADIYAAAIQSDGKIIIGGVFNRVGGVIRHGVIRLNADGSFDPSFNPMFESPSQPTTGSDAVFDIKIQSDNQILLGGDFSVYGGVHPNLSLHTDLARFNPDGTVDDSFVPPSTGTVRSFVLSSDGKIVYASSNSNNLRRLNSNGSGDSSFNNSIFTNVNKLALQPDGKILVGREFGNGIIRLNADGTVDSSFNAGSISGAVRDIIVLSDGKILVGGSFTINNSVSRSYIARLNSDGTLDSTFNYSGGAIYEITALAVLNDGSYVAGIITDVSALTNNKLIRISATGARDPNYAGDVFVRPTVYKIFNQTDGKILVGGSFRKVNGVNRTNVARLNADGTLDTTFNSIIIGDTVYSVAAQADGKVLVGGDFTSPRQFIARYNTDGSFDSTFQPGLVSDISSPSLITEIIPLSDGKILIAGKFRLSEYNFELNVARLNANGTTDTSFIVQQGNPIGLVRAMKLQPNGKIVVGGTFSQIAGASRNGFARLNADGTIDANFGLLGGTGTVFDLAIQSNGNIIIGGSFSSVNGIANHFYLAQLFPDGSLNAAFNTIINNVVYAVEVQADDKILVGSFFDIGGKRGIARFNTNGSLDGTFTGNGTNGNVRDILVQSDNNILIGGEFSFVNHAPRLGIARLLNAAVPATKTPFDFDGDGKSDLSVFRPSNGVWYLQQSTAGFNGIAFGANSDIITPADFDGDGKTDVAVFRPSNGVWYIQQSTAGFTGIVFGAAGDIPMPGDFDGDGKADLAVFRPSNGVWYIQQSTAGFVGVAFGQSGDKPVAADYDGDGKTDIAVNRAGVWYIQRSQLGFVGISFGDVNDKLVPADYDGDGKTDIAVFRPSTGYWYTSTDPNQNYGAVLFGAPGDLPVPADYDGDGKADLAVFRPSNGVWYLQRSTAGFDGVLFGISEDRPIPNAFVR